MARTRATVAADVRPSAGPGKRVEVTGHEFGEHRRAQWVLPPAAVAELARGPAPADMVRDRLRSAGLTLKRCRMPAEVIGLLGNASSMPDVVYERYDIGRTEDDIVTREMPTARQLDELDRVLDWMLWLTPGERRLVFAFMIGVGWRRFARIDRERRSRETLRRIFNGAVDKIWQRLRASDTIR